MGKKKIDWKEMPDGYEKYKAYIKSAEWEEVKKVAKEHYGNHCCCCGRSGDEEQLYVHHNSYEHLYDELNHLDSVILVDKVCHLCIHRCRRNWKQFKKPEKDKGE